MFHPYSFYLQKHKNAKIKRESAFPFFSFPLLLYLVIHTPNVPNRLLLCPISPFGISHFAFWGIPFHLLGYIFGTFAHNVQPRGARFGFFVFAAKTCVFSFQYKKIDPLILLQIFILYMAKERKSFISLYNNQQTNRKMTLH